MGEISKITEEYLELLDAVSQSNKVLQICELCDLIGAIEAHVQAKYNLSLDDLIKMKECTRTSFIEGVRK